LSENLCSLLPNKDRLAISCVFRIYLNGALDTETTPKFFLSVIRSAAKFDYDLVQRIIKKEEIKYDELQYEGKPTSEDMYNKLIDKINILNKLTSLVRTQRIESGSLIIENEEIIFTLNESNYPIDFQKKKKLDSNHLIEELMLIANKLSAEFIYENIKEKAMIRKHPLLNDNKFIEIQRYLSMNKIIVDFEDPQELNDMFLKLEKTNRNKYIVNRINSVCSKKIEKFHAKS
jgi:exoribonuclease R